MNEEGCALNLVAPAINGFIGLGFGRSPFFFLVGFWVADDHVLDTVNSLPVGSQICPLNLNTYHSNSQLLRRTCQGAISARCCNCAPP